MHLLRPIVVTLAALLLALLAVAAPARAAGAFDGAYAVTQATAGMEPFQIFVVVLQNGGQVGLALLDPLTYEWTYGFGSFTSTSQVEGTMFFPGGADYATFTVAFSGSSLTGSLTQAGIVFTLTGNRFF